MYPFAIVPLIDATAETVAGQVSNVTSILGLITAVSTIILGCWLFLMPMAMKMGGKAIGWAKSLMGTGGRRRR